MGRIAKSLAEAVGTNDYEAAQCAYDAPIRNIVPAKSVSDAVLRNGKPIAFTLETTAIAPEAYRLLPEQLIIAVVLLASFIIPILHLLG